MRNAWRLAFVFMFEKVTKYFANRAADNAVDGVKTSLNEKFDEYGDIIRIGLVLAVIVLGGRHITKRERRASDPYSLNDPLRISEPGQPIVINNYYPGTNPGMNPNPLLNNRPQQIIDERRRRLYDERKIPSIIPQQAGKTGRKR